jgi:hypothetical protein
LDVLDRNSMFLSPFSQCFADTFGDAVGPDCPGLSAPLDNAVQASDDPFGVQQEVNCDPQPFAVDIIQHAKKPEHTAMRGDNLAKGFRRRTANERERFLTPEEIGWLAEALDAPKDRIHPVKAAGDQV